MVTVAPIMLVQVHLEVATAEVKGRKRVVTWDMSIKPIPMPNTNRLVAVNQTLRNEGKLQKENFMNKKILGIAMILFVFFVAGISAQSIEQQANTLLNRYETLAKSFESLAKESGTLAAEQRPTKQALTRLENNRQNLLKQQSQNQADWRAFFSTDRDVTSAQQTRMNKITDRIVLADDRIGANIRTINSKL